MHISPLDDEQSEAFEAALEAVSTDAQEGAIEAHIADRGPNAGSVTHGEAIRVLADAYLGRLDIDV